MFVKSYIKFSIFVLTGLTLFSQYSNCQELFRLLPSNPALIQYRAKNPVSRIKSVSNTLLNVPFKDDFSKTSVIPDQSKWDDQNVYINSTFADTLPSLGIATFDVIDANGNIYKPDNIKTFTADILTSKPINLGYSDSTHIWLSFYYLPGGLGDAPSTKDSLILEFDSANIWKPQWKAINYVDSINIIHLDQSTNNWDTTFIKNKPKKFKLAMVQVLNKPYRRNGFRFRFRNTASLTNSIPGTIGNACMWHIDYVYLDTGRTVTDTVYHDLAFFKPMPSLLDPYSSVPFRHFTSSNSLIKSNIEFSIRNNHQTELIPEKYIRITELNVSNPFDSLMILNKEKIPAHSFYTDNPIFNNIFISNKTDDVTFRIKYFISHEFEDEWPDNDTVTSLQVFDNYFAYDDGSPEGGYGINNTNAMVAYGFKTFTEDTLTGISIFFNPTYNNITKNYYLKLGVWADKKGKPDYSLYKDKDGRRLDTIKLNAYNYFHFDYPVPLKSDVRYYVGWYQVSDAYLNIGYDLNTYGRSNLFYNTYGEWLPSGSNNNEIPNGSLMLRPVFKRQQVTGLPALEHNNAFKISPNPAQNYIRISGITDFHKVEQMIFFNTLGQNVKTIQKPSDEIIDLTSISAGLYIVKVIFSDGDYQTVKLLKK